MHKNRMVSRRTFLAAAGGTIISIGLPGAFIGLSEARQRDLTAEIRPDGRPRLPPGQFAVEKINDMGGKPGSATMENWSLRIHGEVDNPIILSYRDLLALDQANITCDVHCVTGWTLLDSKWSGVRLHTIMDIVRPRKNAAFIIFEAPHGYSSNLPTDATQQENVILAHSFFAEKLTQEHGAPVRMVIPDRYFYKSAKWLEGIKLSSRNEPGFWERFGYSDTADPWREERRQV